MQRIRGVGRANGYTASSLVAIRVFKSLQSTWENNVTTKKPNSVGPFALVG